MPITPEEAELIHRVLTTCDPAHDCAVGNDEIAQAEAIIDRESKSIDIPLAIIVYTNHRGETAERHIIPQRMTYGTTDWYREPQWLLVAYDADRRAERTFAMASIRSWRKA
jgi:hypothetical protein